MNKIRNPLDNGGFTLLELLVVVVILGILAGLIAPRIMNKPDEAKVAMAKTQIAGIETALKMYKLDNGSYPTSEQGLLALVEMPEPAPKNYKKGGYFEKRKVPKDPWKNDYIYRSPGLNGDFDLISYGADGIPDGEGVNKDIKNWEIE